MIASDCLYSLLIHSWCGCCLLVLQSNLKHTPQNSFWKKNEKTNFSISCFISTTFLEKKNAIDKLSYYILSAHSIAQSMCECVVCFWITNRWKIICVDEAISQKKNSITASTHPLGDCIFIDSHSAIQSTSTTLVCPLNLPSNVPVVYTDITV